MATKKIYYVTKKRIIKADDSDFPFDVKSLESILKTGLGFFVKGYEIAKMVKKELEKDEWLKAMVMSIYSMYEELIE